MVSLFQQRPEEALDTFVRLAEPGHCAEHPTFALLAALDTAEAAVHVGRRDLAEERVRALEARARRTGAPWARSAAHGARALLGGPHVENAFRAALDVPGARSHPLLHARSIVLWRVVATGPSLAAKQLTKREIVVQPRISHRTVGHHLGNAFAKLGINTRTELSCTRAGSEPR
ncbi:hypothetical protein ACWDWU_39280 [Streptomyces sp. NPDC003442]